jgi:hypothetical protein
MSALKNTLANQKRLVACFYLNFGALAAVLMLGFVRFITGLLRDKPIELIAMALIVLVIVIIAHLW